MTQPVKGDRKYELGHERIYKLLVRYSTPAIVGMFVTALYNVVDTIFIGRGAGTLALGGLAIAFPIQMIALGLAQVAGIGSASMISRALGAGDQRRAERTAGTSFAVVTLLGVVFTIMGLTFVKPLVILFGATPEVLPYAREYLTIVFLGSIFFSLSVSCNNIIRSEGNAKVAMFTMLIGAVVNLILDPIFIFKLDMGIAGAAWATVIGHFCSFVFVTRYFLSGHSLLHIRRGDLAPDTKLLPEMFAVGSASFVRTCSWCVMVIVLNNSIGHYGTPTHLAIIGITNRIRSFYLMPMFGIVQGMQPIVGFNFGACQGPRVRKTLRVAATAATAIATLNFILLMLIPAPILRLFSDDPALVTEGAHILRIMVLLLPLLGVQIIGGGFFQAIGRARAAFVLSIARPFLFQAPAILVFPLFSGLSGIWLSYPVTDVLTFVLVTVWLLAEVRKLDARLAAPPVEPGWAK